MIYYKPDYLEFTRYVKYDCYNICYSPYNNEIQRHIKSGNKLFRVLNNKVYYQKFYGEMLYKITGLNFLNFVGCQ